MRKQTLSVLVNDHPGVLQRVCGLFSRRGYNIESISVGSSEQEGLSRMTIVSRDDGGVSEQIRNQLLKLIDVVQVELLDASPFLSRELMLVKCKLSPGRRHELLGLVDTFRFSVVDVSPGSAIIQVVGEPDKNNAFLQVIHPFGIIEITRTGETAMRRGSADRITGEAG